MRNFNQTLQEKVQIQAGNALLEGNLCIPPGATSIVAFVHGSGSSRLSPRNRYVAEFLNRRGFSTLLFDLLTRAEEQVDNMTAELRFDIEFLAERVIKSTDWIQNNTKTQDLEIGLFGASTGAAAALVSAAAGHNPIKAVVSRGGRPDLAFSALSRVNCPTLLIVGQMDQQVIALNRQALLHLPGTTTKALEIVPGASHLFEEPGTLERVCLIAADWFAAHLCGQSHAA